MATFVRKTDFTATSPGTTFNVTLGTPSTPGNQLVVFIGVTGATGVTNVYDDAGNTPWNNPTYDDEGAYGVEAWTVQADLSVTTLTITAIGTPIDVVVRVLEFSMLDQRLSTYCTDGPSTGTTADSTPVTVPSGYTQIGCIGINDATATVSGQPGAFTLQSPDLRTGSMLLDTGYDLDDATTTAEFSGTLSGAVNASTLILAYPDLVFRADGQVIVNGSAAFPGLPILHESHATFSSGTSFPLTLSTPSTPGNMLVAFFSAHNVFPASMGISDDGGNPWDWVVEQLGPGTDYDFIGGIFWVPTTAIATVVTVTMPQAVDGAVLRVIEVSRAWVLVTAQYGEDNWLNNGTGTAASTGFWGGGFDPKSIAVGMVATYQPSGSSTFSGQTGGFTVHGDLSGGTISLDTGHLLPCGAAAQGYGATVSPSSEWMALVAVFSPAPVTADGHVIVTGTATDTNVPGAKGNVIVSGTANDTVNTMLAAGAVKASGTGSDKYGVGNSVQATGSVKVSGSASTLPLPHADGHVLVSGSAVTGVIVAAPTRVIASASNAEAIVGWTIPFTHDVDITSYTITPYIGGTAQTPTTITGNPPANFTTITGLTNGTDYTFTVFATTADGDGPPSAHSNSVTPQAPQPSDVEIGFEVSAWTPDTNTMIAMLEGGTNIALQVQLNMAGSGSFQINKHDPKIQTISGLLAVGNLIRYRLNGEYVFAFFIEEPNNVEDAPTGPSDEIYQPQGRGAMAYLERATVHPFGWVAGQTSSTTAPLDHTYTNRSAGWIMYDQIRLAKTRGAIPDLHTDFDYEHDSAGNLWPDSQTLNVHIGNDLLTLAGKLAPFGVDFVMNYAPPLTLQAFIAPHQIDRTGTVVFRQGRHLGGSDKSSSQKHYSGMRTRMLVEGESGVAVEYKDATTEANPKFGIREGYLSWGSSKDIPTLSGVGQAAVTDSELQSEPLHVSILHDNLPGGFEPFDDYGLGDLVKLDIPGVYNMVNKRIISMTFSRPQAAGSPLDYNLSVDLGAITLDPLLRLMARQGLGIPLIGISPGPGSGSGPGAGGSGSIGGGVSTSSCCGGEVLMAEAFTAAVLSLIGDQTVLTIPITVDTTNTRIKVEVHCGISLMTGDAPVVVSATLNGETRNVPLQFPSAVSGGGNWNNGSFVVPPRSVLPEGSYDITLDVSGTGGLAFEMGYQVLVYLVTSG